MHIYADLRCSRFRVGLNLIGKFRELFLIDIYHRLRLKRGMKNRRRTIGTVFETQPHSPPESLIASARPGVLEWTGVCLFAALL
jgi:hypothetical protein